VETPKTDRAGDNGKQLDTTPPVPPPNWAQKWQARAAVAQLLLATVGLAWIIAQLRHFDRQRAGEEHRRNIEIMSRLYSWDNEIILMFQKNPRLRPCFFADPEGEKVRELLKADEQERAKIEVELLSICEQYGNMWDYFFHLEKNLKESTAEESRRMHTGWVEYFEITYGRSHLLREYLDKSRGLWGSGFQAKILECSARKDALKKAAMEKVREDDLFGGLRPPLRPKG